MENSTLHYFSKAGGKKAGGSCEEKKSGETQRKQLGPEAKNKMKAEFCVSSMFRYVSPINSLLSESNTFHCVSRCF